MAEATALGHHTDTDDREVHGSQESQDEEDGDAAGDAGRFDDRKPV